MDEVRIWNTVRTEQQLRDNMCRSLTGSETGLAAHYTFDNAADIALQDLSSNTNDGTLINMGPAADWGASSAYNTWLDTDSTAWSTATNWSRGSVPSSSDNVGIADYSGGSDPVISGSTTVNILAVGSSSSLTLGADLGVSSGLVLAGGDVTTGSNTLTVGTSDSNQGRVAWSGGSVVGKLARWFSSTAVEDVIFPVGTAATDLPATISYPTAPPEGGTITVSFTASAPGTNGLPAIDSTDSNYTVDRISEEGFWTVTGGVGFFNTDYDLDLAATGFDSVSDYTELHLLYRNNSGIDWHFWGSHAAGTGSNGFPVAHRTGITYAFGDFAVGSNSSDNPLLIELVSLTAAQCDTGECIRVAWETASELATAGFHVWRGQRAEGRMTNIVRLTDQLIPSEGGASWGAGYEFFDDHAETGQRYFYALEDIDDFGLNTFHGPVFAAIGRERILLLAPAEGAFVPPAPAPIFQWDGAGLTRFRIAFSTTPDLDGDLLVLPFEDTEAGDWIFNQSYIPTPRELRALTRLGQGGRVVYWSVYGQAEPGAGVFAPPGRFTITQWGGE